MEPSSKRCFLLFLLNLSHKQLELELLQSFSFHEISNQRMQLKMEKLYTVSRNKTGADCGSDHELLIAKFRLKLKKVGKTTRPFRYDLNQIPYDYTVEVTSRFKGLDLIECLKNYAKECSNYCTAALISHVSKVILKILQARLQQY